MRETKSTQRRRRLRIIKARDSHSEERIRSAASVSESATQLSKPRENVEQNRQRLAAACGAQLPTRLRLEHPSKETRHVLMNQPSLIIGSHSDCDLQLDDVDVYPHHRLLQWVNGHLFSCDLAPRTGDAQLPTVNGQWIDARPITVGRYQMFCESIHDSGPPTISPLDRSLELSTQLPQLALQFLGVEQSDNKWPINRLLTMIGRGAQCKLRLNHPSMPHVQACLLRMEKSCWLIDVERTGTTGVHGRAIQVAQIGIGDVLQLGPFRVEVVETTFAPINPSPSPSVPKEEISARSKVKLLAPSTADLGLAQRNGSRKNSPPPKSPSLVESSDSNSAITEISKNNTPGGPKKRTVPRTAILETGRPAAPQAPIQSPGATVPHLATPGHSAPSGTSTPKSSITILQQTRPADGNASAITGDSKNLATRTTVMSVEEFLQDHQLQLARLHANLNQLKQVCDRPSRRSISKRARTQIEKSIQDTFRTQKAMQESLASFGKSLCEPRTRTE